MSVPEVEEINISCEAGMEESFPGASAPKRNGSRGFGPKRSLLQGLQPQNEFLTIFLFGS